MFNSLKRRSTSASACDQWFLFIWVVACDCCRWRTYSTITSSDSTVPASTPRTAVSSPSTAPRDLSRSANVKSRNSSSYLIILTPSPYLIFYRRVKSTETQFYPRGPSLLHEQIIAAAPFNYIPLTESYVCKSDYSIDRSSIFFFSFPSQFFIWNEKWDEFVCELVYIAKKNSLYTKLRCTRFTIRLDVAGLAKGETDICERINGSSMRRFLSTYLLTFLPASGHRLITTGRN